MMLGCILSRPPSAVNKSGISEADDAAVLKDAEHPLPQHKEDGFGLFQSRTEADTFGTYPGHIRAPKVFTQHVHRICPGAT